MVHCKCLIYACGGLGGVWRSTNKIPLLIHNTNKRHMREYEQYLDEKARMDMRVGRKPKNSPTADRSLRRRHGRNQWKRGC